ncbi:penicillin-binding protein [Tessaracoccus sp. MC1627]|uniref:penicillin-binding transpeptidase domain-containing protein n=1 Tax=Tessaracoccus sp. MC1627 TaxID=2760312 RepID=UPI0016038428|nr:penicillin-binding transpeptidase domain-containing protein [Tessaracoccus sp. MC1627]MBB1511341.1 penicillin-binding protein [Tessaracoccus sp. MC1627]
MRRRLLAAAMTLALLLAGCAPGPDPDPNPSGSQAGRPDLPPIDEALTAVVDALNAQDVSGLPMVGVATEAQTDFEAIFAGMDEIYPTVSAGPVAYEANDDVAVATLTMSFQLGKEGWTYPSEARLRYSGDKWRLSWAPSIIHPELTEATRLRHTLTEGRRAPINDNAGVAIVEEGAMFEVGLDKSSVEAAEWPTASSDLAAILEVDAAAFTKKVLANGPRAFVVAATMVQAEIPPTISQVPGAYVREISAIVGPGGSFAAPILGSVGTPTKEMIDESGGTLTIQDRVGLSGLQARYDEQLRGVPSVRVDLVPRQDAAAEESASPAPEKALFQQDQSVGSGIDLSLDRDLQTKAEEVLSTQTGMAALVVLDVADGGVLAAAQSPAGGTYPHVTYGNYAPGSTFKAVSALAMLRSGLTPSSTVNCPASLTVGTYTFGNYSGYPSGSLGRIPLSTAFAQSCNTAFAGASESITGEQLHAAAGSLGVGTDYDVGFTSNFGTVQPANSIDLAASMIGQGQVTMSPLGMATVAASVAAGRTVLPWLVKGEEATPTAAPLTAAEAESLQSLMETTVTSGTGRSLQGVMTGAKTGTAQWGTAGALQTSAWMIAYNDRYAVASFVEVGDSGGTTAAPLIISLFR